MGEDGTSGFEAIALQFELGDTKRLLDVARRENTELHDKNQGLTAEKGRLQAALEDTNQLLDEARRENTKLQADYRTLLPGEPACLAATGALLPCLSHTDGNYQEY